MSDEDIFSLFIGALVLVCGALLVLSVYASIQAVNDCNAAGGTMRSFSGMGVGISPNGQAVPTVTTTSVCVSRDGRIL